MLPFGGMRLVGLKEGKKRSKRRKEKKEKKNRFPLVHSLSHPAVAKHTE